MFPFIYPIIANNLIKFEIIESIEILEKYLQIFKGFNVLLIICMIILILYERNISISDILEKIVSNFDFSYKRGDSELQVKHKSELHENEIHKSEATKLAKDVKKEAQNLLFNKGNVSNTQCQECRKEEILSERESLRYFSAYQITNKYSRDLLKDLKNNGKIKIEDFKNNMQEYMEYYDRRIKHMGKKRKQEYITKKIEELLYNLRYINIIEYTEDDLFIILTKNGEDFVDGYYKEEVG